MQVKTSILVIIEYFNLAAALDLISRNIKISPWVIKMEYLYYFE